MTRPNSMRPIPLLTWLCLTSAWLASAAVQAQPSQVPLMVNATGAKPNLTIALDNSGSMGYPYHETYGVLADVNTAVNIRNCVPTNGNAYPAFGLLPLARPEGTPSAETAAAAGNICITRGGNPTRWRWRQGTAYVPARQVTGSWAAQRSAQVNPLYYNPAITYKRRVNSSGTEVTPTDNWNFVSNAVSDFMHYEITATNPPAYYLSTLGGTNSSAAPNNNSRPARPAAPTSAFNTALTYVMYESFRVPVHSTYTNATSAVADPFTYVTCTNVMTNPANGLQDGCAAWTETVIRPGIPAIITLPVGHKRTDCGTAALTCTNQQEIENIKNWYRYYSFRQQAVSTAIGQAITNEKYDKKLRIGYLNINEGGAALAKTPGTDTNAPSAVRGVRLFTRGDGSATAVIDWLNGQVPWGGTPLHNALNKAATHYAVSAEGAQENPWRTNPTSATSPEMSCRRSFTLLFSDGAWTATTATNAGSNADNSAGTLTKTRTLANGLTDTFTYSPNTAATEAGRKKYTPYGGPATGGLADLAATYFWNTDLRTTLDDDVRTRVGQPTFWQNMATYTIGYLIRPSGEVPSGTGLTFDQIEDYKAAYADIGVANPTKPTWPTEAMASASTSLRINDFIQAGYTGGGRGFSVTTADDVRSAFDTVLSDILDASGNDAGVAVSGAGSSGSGLAGRLKYLVSYQTSDNSGDITAIELDEDGNAVSQGTDTDGNPILVKWTAGNQIKPHDERVVYTRTGDGSSGQTIEFSGDFSALPADVKKALNRDTTVVLTPTANNIPADSSFVDYLRGSDPESDSTGKLWRQRTSALGAMVNPPSIFMGGSLDSKLGEFGTVEGRTSYEAYTTKKTNFPPTLMVATNAGALHTLKASTGEELMAYMPRRSLKRMLDYANPDYIFEYTLDGPLSEHDIYSRDTADASKGEWNHLAIGTGGRGEQLIYGIRSPLNEDSAGVKNRTPADVDVLWEIGPEQVDVAASFKMGYITNEARSGQTADTDPSASIDNGTWIAVINSGHYNGETDGTKHGLIVLNPMTGEVLKRLPVPGDAGRGLGGVTVLRDSNRRIVAAYAGDGKGNLWRFDLRGDANDWAVSYSKPLFTAKDNKAVYGPPAFQSHPEGGTIVVFATGVLLEEADLEDTYTDKKDAIYGIWDPTPVGEDDESSFTAVEQADLLVQSVTGSITVANEVANDGIAPLTSTASKIDWKTQRGWTMELGLATGERNITGIANVGNSVFITTTVLANEQDSDAETCTAANSPKNYMYGLNALDGAARTSFDVTGDGKLDKNVSIVEMADGGYGRGAASATISSESVSPSCTGDCGGGGEQGTDGIDGSNGEAPIDPTGCVEETEKVTGVNSGSLTRGTVCSSAAWTRTQFQLSAPPKN